jgi:hypothetical protein
MRQFAIVLLIFVAACALAATAVEFLTLVS